MLQLQCRAQCICRIGIFVNPFRLVISVSSLLLMTSELNFFAFSKPCRRNPFYHLITKGLSYHKLVLSCKRNLHTLLIFCNIFKWLGKYSPLRCTPGAINPHFPITNWPAFNPIKICTPKLQIASCRTHNKRKIVLNPI